MKLNPKTDKTIFKTNPISSAAYRKSSDFYSCQGLIKDFEFWNFGILKIGILVIFHRVVRKSGQPIPHFEENLMLIWMVYRLTYFDRPHFEKSAHQRSKMGPSRSVFCSSPPPGGIFEFFLNCIRFCSKFCTTYAHNEYHSFESFLLIFEKTTKLKIFKNPCIDKNGNFSSSDWSINLKIGPHINVALIHL